jgi:hypothetical protein
MEPDLPERFGGRAQPSIEYVRAYHYHREHRLMNLKHINRVRNCEEPQKRRTD